jgi:hypothetical protein
MQNDWTLRAVANPVVGSIFRTHRAIQFDEGLRDATEGRRPFAANSRVVLRRDRFRSTRSRDSHLKNLPPKTYLRLGSYCICEVAGEYARNRRA